MITVVGPKLKIEYINKDALKLVSKAARTCYASEEKDKKDTREAFITGIIDRGHTSVIEHVSVSFVLSNVSRACVNQLERHRIASYSQLSQRYVRMNNTNVILPWSIINSKNTELAEKIKAHIYENKKLYVEMLEKGIKPEDARYILPEGTETKVFFTFNLRQIRNFLSLRLSTRAQEEIRLIAMSMYEQLKEIYPWLVHDMEGMYKEAVDYTERKRNENSSVVGYTLENKRSKSAFSRCYDFLRRLVRKHW